MCDFEAELQRVIRGSQMRFFFPYKWLNNVLHSHITYFTVTIRTKRCFDIYASLAITISDFCFKFTSTGLDSMNVRPNGVFSLDWWKEVLSAWDPVHETLFGCLTISATSALVMDRILLAGESHRLTTATIIVWVRQVQKWGRVYIWTKKEMFFILTLGFLVGLIRKRSPTNPYWPSLRGLLCLPVPT